MLSPISSLFRFRSRPVALPGEPVWYPVRSGIPDLHYWLVSWALRNLSDLSDRADLSDQRIGRPETQNKMSSDLPRERCHQRRWAPASACMDLVWPLFFFGRGPGSRITEGTGGTGETGWTGETESSVPCLFLRRPMDPLSLKSLQSLASIQSLLPPHQPSPYSRPPPVFCRRSTCPVVPGFHTAVMRGLVGREAHQVTLNQLVVSVFFCRWRKPEITPAAIPSDAPMARPKTTPTCLYPAAILGWSGKESIRSATAG